MSGLGPKKNRGKPAEAQLLAADFVKLSPMDLENPGTRRLGGLGKIFLAFFMVRGARQDRASRDSSLENDDGKPPRACLLIVTGCLQSDPTF